MKISELLFENNLSTAIKIAKELHLDVQDLNDILDSGSSISAGNSHNIKSLKDSISQLVLDLKELGYVYDESEPNHIKKLDNVSEKWSAKYKRSINCNNPKGFSQRAHCQGRKK